MDLGALSVGTADVMSWIALAALVLLAVAVVALIGKVLVKFVVVALIVVLAVAVWNQRSALAECPKTCSCSFFGYHLELPGGSVNDACQQIVGRVG